MRNKLLLISKFFAVLAILCSSAYAQLSATTTYVNATCAGSCNGTATANPSGGTPPYTYSWSPGGATTQTATGLCPGIYTVTVTDAVSATTMASATITQPAALTVNPSGSPTICVGGSTSVSVSPTGGTPPYTYNWSPPSGLSCTTCSNPLATPAGTTVYTVSVNDVNGCTANANITVTVNAAPVITIGASLSTICTGQNTILTASGATTYSWNTSATTSSINVSPAINTTYTVTGTNVQGCTNTATKTITVNPTPASPNISSSSPVCAGQVLYFAASNIGGATYMWTGPNGFTSSIQNPMISMPPTAASGTYTLTASVSGCTSIPVTALVSVDSALNFSNTKTNISCFGANDGTAIENPVGGTAPYTYSWSCGSSTQSVTNLPPGLQVVQVMDALGCSTTDSIIINTPSAINILFTPVSATCGSSNGGINAVVTGGIGPYTYQWADGSTSVSLSNIPSGQYFLSVADMTGCMVSSTGNVNDNGGPTVTLNSTTNVSCNGGSDGALNTTISGGAAPLTIQWMNGLTTSTITNLPAGSYDLTVTDASGCNVYRTYTVTEPSLINLSSSSSLPSSCGSFDGSATMSLSGGVAPYSYAWDMPAGYQTTATAINLGAGAYRVLITDANGCSDSSYVSVSDMTSLYINVDSTFDAGCITTGTGIGAIYITPNGGVGPYNFAWTNGTSAEDATGLGKGIFGVTVTDIGTGCKVSESKFINGIQPGNPQICLVTVDTATNHNIIVWEKNVPGIKTYTIYRESSVQGNFNLIATIPADSLSTFEDTLANAGVKPWNYEIRVIDSCNFVSVLSLSHQSIFLTVSQGTGSSVDLNWTPYVGTPFSTYYIYRRTTTSPWALIDSTLIGTTIYNDALAPSPIDSLEYLIEIEPTNPCNPSRAAINTSRSNIKNTTRLTNPTGVKEAVVEAKALVFPNPAQSELNIKIDRKGRYNVQVYDIAGRRVFINNPELSSQNSVKLNIAELESGVYILKLVFTDGKVYRTKFIKQ